MSQYDGVISIDKFLGINRASDEHNTSIRYAYKGKNFDTHLGGLTSLGDIRKLNYVAFGETETIIHITDIEASAPTLAFLNKRWKKGVSGIIPTDSYTNGYAIVIAGFGGKVYYRQKDWNGYDHGVWTEIPHDEPFAYNKFDWISYELNRLPPETLTSTICAAIHDESKSYSYFDLDKYEHFDLKSDTGTDAYYVDMEGVTHTLTVNTDKVRENSYDAPVDCLLLTNSYDGMYCIYAPLDSEELKMVQVPVMPVGTVDNIKFGCIARYAERIWGSGIDSDPDKYMYSAPFDPFNWEQNNIDPAEGAGDDQQPNWDGDKFVALKPFGNSLLMFKKHGIWKLAGTNPTEFAVRKMYGEGTIEEDTIAIHNATAFFLNDDPEIMRFDGSASYSYMYQTAKGILPQSGYMAGRIVNGKYYLLGNVMEEEPVIPQTGSAFETHYYTRLFIYDLAEGTLNIKEIDKDNGRFVQFCTMETDGNNLYGLGMYYNSDTSTFDMHLYNMFGGAPLDVEWESAWQDIGAKNVDKSGFIVYLVVDSEGAITDDIFTLDVGIETERKVKIKTVQMKYNKMKRIRINNHGRQFKIKFHIPVPDNIHRINHRDWRISTGVQIYQEYDAD